MKKILVLALVLLLGLSLLSMAAGKVAVVLDVGGRGDLSFNDSAFKGADQAAKDFGLELVEVQNATGADYLPNIRNLARSGDFDLIICVGYLLGDALNVVAVEFPDQKFAIIDVDDGPFGVSAPNVMNFVFRENEVSALVGALGAMAAAHYGFPYVGLVLGIEIPVLYHFEAGYRFGIDWGNKMYAEITGTPANAGLLYTYTGSFTDPAVGKASTEAMIAQGAVAAYNVAGGVGAGMLAAVAEFHTNARTRSGPPYYFGVDANQDYLGLGLHVLASGMKRVDVACYTAIEAVVTGTFKAGMTDLGLIERGVGLSRLLDLFEVIDFAMDAGAIKPEDRDATIANWAVNRGTVPAWIWRAVDELEAGILDGTILVPTANTLDEMKAVRAQYTLGAP